VPSVRRDLSDGDGDVVGMGTLAGPDGRTYRRRATRLARCEIESLVEAGTPVVAYLPGGRIVWHDEDDAWPAWADARPALTTELPAAGAEQVTASRWEGADGGAAVVLVWHG
jgi:hypothetical protein